MGRLENEPVIQHFSHPHPLELCNSQQALVPSTCVGCHHPASGWIYTCRTCNYVLHVTCAKMPQFISHRGDPNHALALLAVPAYPEGYFNCDACGQKGRGFSYHCGTCGLDIHTLCASMPLSVTHQMHPHHTLTLTFSSPYQNQCFSCDICGQPGTNHWLYRCAACSFDVHLGCATAKPRQQAPQPQNYRPQQPRFGIPLLGNRGCIPQQQPAAAVMGMPAGKPGLQKTWGPAQPAMRTDSNNQTNNGLVNQVFQGILQGASEQLGQNLAQSIFGGGDPGENSGSGGDIGCMLGGDSGSSE